MSPPMALHSGTRARARVPAETSVSERQWMGSGMAMDQAKRPARKAPQPRQHGEPRRAATRLAAGVGGRTSAASPSGCGCHGGLPAAQNRLSRDSAPAATSTVDVAASRRRSHWQPATDALDDAEDVRSDD